MLRSAGEVECLWRCPFPHPQPVKGSFSPVTLSGFPAPFPGCHGPESQISDPALLDLVQQVKDYYKVWPHGLYVRGISQARIPPPGALPNPGIKPMSPALASRFFTTEPPGKPVIYIFQLKKDLPGGPVIGISLPVKESWRIPGPGRFHGATKPMGHNC